MTPEITFYSFESDEEIPVIFVGPSYNQVNWQDAQEDSDLGIKPIVQMDFVEDEEASEDEQYGTDMWQ